MKQYNYAKCAKYFRYMFLLIIPSIIVGVLTNERIVGSTPTVKTVGLVLRVIISLINAYFIYQLASEDERYKKAAILSVCIAVINIASNLIPAGRLALRVIVLLIGLAVGVFFAINYYSANADVLSEPDPSLSARWLLIKKLYLIEAALTCAFMMMVSFAPLLTLLAAFAAVIMTLVVYIMELIALNKSSKICAQYAQTV